MLMFLMPLLSFAADTIRVNIPRVTVTMARSYNFSSAANSVYVPVEFNSTMSADKVADYIEESNAFLFDHYGEDVVEISGVSDDFGTIYLDIKPNTGIKRVLLITSTGSGSKVITVVQAGDTPKPEPEPEPEPDEKFNIPGNWKMVRHYTDETGENYVTDITFYDGLGYPSQIVNVGASPAGNRNIVTPIVYDRKGRVMQVVEKNSTGGISRTSTKYDFRGNILAVNESHSAGSLTITKGTVYSYDQRGRMLSERVSINGAEKATVNYSYDALGNLTGKSYGNGVTDNLQYNIQGWGTVSQTVKGSETLYSQRLSYYDAEKGSGLYNGNISEWRMQQGTNAASTYRYGYDGLGRLTTSSRYAGSGTSATNSWCERGIDYDLNGNIVTLQRFGSNSITVEDNLVYGYTGNRLTALTGSSQGGALNASYSYDAGGNMLYDGRRGLGISYNILNLPAKVVEKTGATAADGAVKAEYLYSADGIKQRVVDGTGSNGYLYLGTLVLSKSGDSYSLASTGFGGGRIIGAANNSCLAYYYGTDHLGSVRVITDGSGSVVERNDYYPMGMRTATGNSYPQLTANLYKYNGKEVQTVGGLGFTDYGARMYDDFTGRWFVPDPLAEETVWSSPFSFNQNNPINRIDLTGRKDNPVYDTYGNFLGTNDLGLQGDAIIMDRSDFKQGMSLEESMSKHKGYNSFVSEDAKNKYLEHYSNLPNRPDYDGYLTLNEANKWYREGNGQPLFVSLEKIDMSGVYSKGDKAVDERWTINLLRQSKSINDGLVYGSIQIKQYPNDYVRAYADTYDFEMHPWKWSTLKRNIFTIIGRIYARKGTKYEINIYGSKKLQKEPQKH